MAFYAENRMFSAGIKILLVPLLYCLGLVVAGAYGALHNQISYTVAPSYFHGHKFVQFGIPPEFHDRIGAAIVGWHASWWMGKYVGPPVILIALLVPGWKLYLSRTLIAMGVMVATTLCVGLAALAYSVTVCSDADAFEHAGHMHNFSYLGGFLGILTGSAYVLYQGVTWQTRLAANGYQGNSQMNDAQQTTATDPGRLTESDGSTPTNGPSGGPGR
jgi:hypothetical protein